MNESAESLLWPSRYQAASDLAVVEAVPLEARSLPASTYSLFARAAGQWPDRIALSVLPDALHWRTARLVTYGAMLDEVHRYANVLYALGVGRGDAVALMAPNCAELVTATLAAQLAGIAAPLNRAFGPEQARGLLRRSSARGLIAARRELTDALAQVDGIRAVYAEMEDDALVVEIECETASGNDAAAAIASQYAITWRVVVRP